MSASDGHGGPRETAAGLQRDGEDPTAAARRSTSAGVDPATQAGRVEAASTPDEQSTRAKAQRHGKVTADNWNQ